MAVQSDWQKYSAAMNEWQNQGGRASGPPPKAVRDFQRAQGQARDAELKAKGYGPAVFKAHADVGKASTSLSLHYDPKTDKWVTMEEMKAAARFKGPSVDEIRHAAKTGKTLHITTPSTCFDSLTWKDGVVSAVFQNGYSYSTDLDLDTFMQWSADGSLGKFFNQVLGQDFFAD
jgi:hypothetical protein